MEKKNIALYIILSIVTCGIFALIWVAKLADDINIAANENDKMSGGMVVLLSILTCGIYMMVWYYQSGKAISKAKAMRNMPGDSSLEIIYLILGLCGFGIVSVALMQNELNNMIDASAKY